MTHHICYWAYNTTSEIACVACKKRAQLAEQPN